LDFKVPGFAFTVGTPYSIEISLLQTRDGLSTDLDNPNVYAISRVYADFTTSNTGGPVVNLPVVKVDGGYQYNMTVVAGRRITSIRRSPSATISRLARETRISPR
jgi:hypothetical protein